MAIKQAAKRPALSFHSSFVNKYVAMAVRPLQMKMRQKGQQINVCALLNAKY